MVIRKGYEDRGYARRARRMERAKERAMKACREERQRRDALGRNGKFRKRGSIHYEALAEAVAQEGPEVLSAAADGYWKDMERANPWMMIDGTPEDGNSLNGHKGCHGKVAKRYVHGKGWMEWKDGGWRRVEDRGKTLRREGAEKQEKREEGAKKGEKER